MDKTLLVDPGIEEGRRFLDQLEEAKIKVNAALWQKDEEFGRWSLVIVTPLVETLGLKETYRRVRAILKLHPLQIDLLNVSLVAPKASISRGLRRELAHTKNRALFRQPVGDQYVEEGFIYFVK